MNAIELYIPWKIDMDTILDSLGSVQLYTALQTSSSISNRTI